MDCSKYEEMLNDVRSKAPLEAGVQTVVFWLLHELLSENYAVVDVHSMGLEQARHNYATSNKQKLASVPDIVIVDKQFQYRNIKDSSTNSGDTYGFVEVKYLATPSNPDTDQMQSYFTCTKHVIWTNGVKWEYYCEKKHIWTVDLCPNKCEGNLSIAQEEYDELLKKIGSIKWK